MYTGFSCGNLREGKHLEDPRVERRIILKWIFEKWDGDKDKIELPHYRYRWRVVVNAVMDLSVP